MAAEITPLKGWVALPEAAEELGITRSGLWFRVNQGLVPAKHMRSVRNGSRSMILISTKYLEEHALAEAAG